MKNLYSQLGVSLSKSVYIHKNQWECFTSNVMPFLNLVNTERAIQQPNT
jgi:hypothetical protein